MENKWIFISFLVFYFQSSSVFYFILFFWSNHLFSRFCFPPRFKKCSNGVLNYDW